MADPAAQCEVRQRDADPILRASGAWLYGASGAEYLDFAHAALCYQHPLLVKQAAAALGQMPLSSRMFFSAPLAQLTSRLARIMWGGAAVVYPCNSASEAMEGALKLALGVHRGRRSLFVTTHDSFHGTTLGSLAISGARELAQLDLTQAPIRTRRIVVDAGDIAAVDRSVAAVVLEPVRTSAGFAPLPPGFFERIRKICTETGALLIVNESLTGLGRTGRTFGWQACVTDSAASPDVVVLGDTLGGNLIPYGAYIARAQLNALVYKKANPALHGATTAGHPLGCSVALAVLELLDEAGMPGRAREFGEMLSSGLGAIERDFPDAVEESRAIGLIGALKLQSPFDARRLSRICDQSGLWLQSSGGSEAQWIGILPPLLVSHEELTEGIRRLSVACARAFGGA